MKIKNETTINWSKKLSDYEFNFSHNNRKKIKYSYLIAAQVTTITSIKNNMPFTIYKKYGVEKRDNLSQILNINILKLIKI